jgi:hypothetical protein
MSRILIELCEPSEQGRLYYRDDRGVEDKLWVFQARQRRLMTYSVNIDGGRGLLYFDANRILQDMEFARRGRNYLVNAGLERPSTTRAADLHFVGIRDSAGDLNLPSIHTRNNGSTIQCFEIDTDVRVTTTPDNSCAKIDFGTPSQSAVFIELSEQCLACVVGDVLLGFWVRAP